MVFYNEHYIWYNKLRGGYILQQGLDYVGTYKTISAAKRLATMRYNKGVYNV